MDEEPKPRISNVFALGLIFFAFVMDCLGALANIIPFLSPIVEGIGGAALWLAFKFKHVNFSDGKKFTALMTMAIIEALPFINALPGLTIWTINTCVLTQAEDRIKLAEFRKKRENMQRMQRRRIEEGSFDEELAAATT